MRLAGQIATLARRGITAHFLRQPVNVFPSVLFPLLFLAFTVAGARRAAEIPGFPARGYLDFMLPAALVQGTMLLGINAGSSLALDIEEGFIRRLLLTPMRRTALLFGHIGGVTLAGCIVASIILVAGLATGARVNTGIVGALLVIVLSVSVTLAFASIGALIAAGTGSAEATQSVFPLFFVIMVFSSFFMPRELIDVGWFRAVANANPATYVIEAIRGLITTGWDAGQLGLGAIAIAAITFAGLVGASAALRRRIARAV